MFQPVGGVYHVNEPMELWRNYGFYRDSTPGDREDVRGELLGKDIKKFIKWFNKEEKRENSPNREFIEELIKTKLFPKKIFRELKFQFDKTYYKGICYSHRFNILELHRFDVYDFIPSKKQQQSLLNAEYNSSILKNIYY